MQIDSIKTWIVKIMNGFLPKSAYFKTASEFHATIFPQETN